MRRLGPLLLLCQQTLARGPRFSIHDDIFAHPQVRISQLPLPLAIPLSR